MRQNMEIVYALLTKLNQVFESLIDKLSMKARRTKAEIVFDNGREKTDYRPQQAQQETGVV